jgi:isopentenyl diphosphate isomerase/L-lactate dehydrogenase-like FMN-dependent dehydrogenase
MGPSLQLLNEELRLAMALAGVASLAEINRSLVAHETSYFSKL